MAQIGGKYENIEEIWWEIVDSTDVTQGSEKWWGFCEHSNEHLCSIKCKEFLD